MSKTNLEFLLLAGAAVGAVALYMAKRKTAGAVNAYPNPFSDRVGMYPNAVQLPTTVPAQDYNPFTDYLKTPPRVAVTPNLPVNGPADSYNPFTDYLRTPPPVYTPPSAPIAGSAETYNPYAGYLLTPHGIAPSFGGSISTNSAQERAAVMAGISKASYSARGLRNNNPGNLRKGIAWKGLASNQTDASFSVFSTPEYGIRAMARTLASYRRNGITTIRGIISRWAPSSENDTRAYINAVAAYVGIGADQQVNYSTNLVRLIQGIIQHENGSMPYTYAQVKRGIDMSGSYA